MDIIFLSIPQWFMILQVDYTYNTDLEGVKCYTDTLLPCQILLASFEII